MDEQYQDEEEEGESGRAAGKGGGAEIDAAVGGFYGWPSSRIVRVSRACGGKDRHSKVLTSKGLRDRRVRLSVNTAIQFYDLQDRLGYDQPSKAVEWLLKAAASSIDDLPPMSISFPDTRMQQPVDEKRASTGGGDQPEFDAAEVDMDAGGDSSFSQQLAAGKSASETSKSSGLSLSRSGSWIKEGAAQKENGSLSHTASFTELLNGGISNANGGGGGATNESSFLVKPPQTWLSSLTDYFCSGLVAPPYARAGFAPPPQFGVAAGDMQQFSFPPENMSSSNMNPSHNGSHEYNMSCFSNSSGHAGFNRGTLQSNISPPSLLRYPDGSPPSFFIGAEAADNNHQHQSVAGYEARLQLAYGEARGNGGSRYSGQKLKGKN